MKRQGMAKNIGLLTRADIKDGGKARRTSRSIANLPDEDLHRIGLRGVSRMNPLAKHPNMEPTGSKKPLIYILGEAPGAEEDKVGKHFVGKSGQLLRSHIPAKYTGRIRWGYACCTRPPKNRTPSRVEIECFRPSVQEDIEKHKPKVVVAIGGVALSWFIQGLPGSITVSRGRWFPIRVGNHKCWLYPILQPAYILRNLNEDERKGFDTWGRLFKNEVRAVFAKLPKLPEPVLEDTGEDNLYRGVTALTGRSGDLATLKSFLKELQREPIIACDLECTHLRPYSEGSKILSLAVGTYDRVLSVAINHHAAEWSGKNLAYALGAIKRFFQHAKARVAFHNAQYDIEWLSYFLGDGIILPTRWECTMQQAYILDERKGGHSLDYLTALHFGFRIKPLSDVDRSKLDTYPLEQVLRYNAVDVKYTYKLWHVQDRLLSKAGLAEVYERQSKVPATLALTQKRGIGVSQVRARRIVAKLEKQAEKVEAAIAGSNDVAKFESRYGAFNPLSPTQVANLFGKMLKRRECQRADGKYHSGEDALKAIGSKLATAILSLRSLRNKQLATYTYPLLMDSKSSIVFPDGCIHTSFNSTFTNTGRLSSDGPNMQNFPKRDPVLKKLRKIIVPREVHTFVSVDYGQIEARIIGISSADRVLCASLWDEYDIHRDWALRVAKQFPTTMKRRYGSTTTEEAIKAFRSDIKNQLVFPAFYGATAGHCANMLEMPLRKFQPIYDAFWSEFRGVKSMQRRYTKEYLTQGYVSCLTGRRRHAPLTMNELINTPIQGTASDVVVDAMVRLSRQSLEEDKLWLQPILNIHDDLTFDVPTEKLDDAIEDIVCAMLAVPFGWLTVPITVEVEIGKDWYAMEEVGKFRSDDILGIPERKVA
jgi:uracil-DNA glycosylase family 4